jgi:hypothetical protein
VTFLHGCNYPWSTDGRTVFYGMDFGANVWGSHLGVSTRRDAIANDFLEMARLGFTVARWFVFCDGRAGIVYDPSGMPAGLDDYFFADMDTALEIVREAGIRLDLVLLDHRWMFKKPIGGVVDDPTGIRSVRSRAHGRAEVLLTSSGRRLLFERVFEPLVTRYGASGERLDLEGQIASFELMNEPDFVISDWKRDLSRHVAYPVSFAVFGEMVSELSRLVHASSSALVTLGCARLRNLHAWDDPSFGLDLLQVHSYPDTRRLFRAEPDIFGMPAASLGVGRGVILGEFPGDGPTQHPRGASPPATTLDEYLEFALSGGYAGAWPWSFSGTDAYGRLPPEPLRGFAARHPDLVNPLAFTGETDLPDSKSSRQVS